MKFTLMPHRLAGRIALPPSKSIAHRHFFLAALSGKVTRFKISALSDDLRATLHALGALGVESRMEGDVLHLVSGNAPDEATVDCMESASTLRMAMMILPTRIPHLRFVGKASLFARPMDEGIRYLEKVGVEVNATPESIETKNTYAPKSATMTGKTTSQFITGAMLAATTAHDPVTITVKEETSAPYLRMTEEILREWGMDVRGATIYPGELTPPSPLISIEGDRSHAAFFHAANAIGAKITMENIAGESLQGDDAFPDLLRLMKKGETVDLTSYPDLLMPLAVVAAKTGGVLTGVERLRLKESDRIAATQAMLAALGIDSSYKKDIFTVFPGAVKGGVVDTRGDHRIAFAAGILSGIADGPVTILGSECIAKSWGSFWEDLESLRQ